MGKAQRKQRTDYYHSFQSHSSLATSYEDFERPSTSRLANTKYPTSTGADNVYLF